MKPISPHLMPDVTTAAVKVALAKTAEQRNTAERVLDAMMWGTMGYPGAYVTVSSLTKSKDQRRER